jgi:hypothetical protein
MKPSILTAVAISIITFIVMFALPNPYDRAFTVTIGILIAITAAITVEQNKKQ